MKGKAKQRKMKAKLGDAWWMTRRWQLVHINHEHNVYEYVQVPHQ